MLVKSLVAATLLALVAAKSHRIQNLPRNLPHGKHTGQHCQGDCDRNSDCRHGLVCQQNDTSSTTMKFRGCHGRTRPGWDYCVPHKIQNLPRNLPAGRRTGKQCQGDCDRNSDCGRGLICQQNNTSSTTMKFRDCHGKTRPGWDYCVPARDHSAAHARRVRRAAAAKRAAHLKRVRAHRARRAAAARRARAARAGQFGNMSFLRNMKSFEEAQRARARFVKRQMQLVRIRAMYAHHYFNAKNRAAAHKRIVHRFNRMLAAWVRRHHAAIKAHKISHRRMRLAWRYRLRTMKHHKLTLRSLHIARHHESRALKAYRHSRIMLSKARSTLRRAKHWYLVYLHRMHKAKKHWMERRRRSHVASAHERRAHAKMVKANRHHANMRHHHGKAHHHMRRMAAHRKQMRERRNRAVSAHRHAIRVKAAAYRRAVRAHHNVIRHAMSGRHHW